MESTPKNFERVETSGRQLLFAKQPTIDTDLNLDVGFHLHRPVLEATENRRQEHQLFLAGKTGKLTARHIRFKSFLLVNSTISGQDHNELWAWTFHCCVQPEGDLLSIVDI